MSVGSPHSGDASAPSAHALAAAADARGQARLNGAIGDLFLSDEARLSDRTRAAVHRSLSLAVTAVEAELRRHAARLLAGRGAPAQAETLLHGRPVLDRLVSAGVLRNPELMAELIARVELDLLADSIPPTVSEPERPSLLARLADAPDGVVADAARALLATESRRRGALEGGGASRTELPAELHQRLVWWVAAAVREQASDLDGPEFGGGADRDRALTEAAARSLAAHDEGDRPEAAAARLASALDAREDELPPLLVEAAGDRRLTLFVALLARATSVDYEQARALVIDPVADLLLLLLHAAGVGRAAIARIGVLLAEADGRRDLDALADAVDRAAAHDRATARAALAPLALGQDFRAAVHALGRPA